MRRPFGERPSFGYKVASPPQAPSGTPQGYRLFPIEVQQKQ
jgi:hypothetical protein